MDYLVELARHPEIVPAIEVEEGSGVSASAQRLRRYEFLREEHPNTWLVELVHTFYADPAFAYRVWVSLRYCDTFRRALAERLLTDRSSWWTRGMPSRLREVVSDDEVVVFKQNRKAAVDALAKRLSHESINELCTLVKLHPEPPSFLADLLDAERITDQNERDTRAREYFEDPELVRRTARDTGLAVPFSMMLESELTQIEATRDAVHRSQDPHHDPDETAPYRIHSARQALDQNLLGLAFSGGGIRSATFNLGVLQTLSKIGLLKHFDYLSTVSGGGYIGSWFSAWTHRESMKHDEPADAIAEMQRRLSPARTPNPLDDRVKPIRFLREYSNYLTPRTGFFSADTWTMLGIYIRNTLLNQVIIVALFAAVLLLPRNVYLATAFVATGWWLLLPVALWILGAALLALNLCRLDPHSSDASVGIRPAMMPSDVEVRPPWYAQPRAIQRGVILPWLVAATLVATQWGRWALCGDSLQACDGVNAVPAALWVGAFVAVSLLAILAVGRSDRCWADQASPLPTGVEAALTILGSAAVAGVVAAGLTWVLVRVLLAIPEPGEAALRWHLNAIGTAGLMSVVSLAIVAMLGMLGEKFPDEHREWWSRVRTFLHVYAMAWLAWFVASVYVPWGFHVLRQSDLVTGPGLTALAAWIASTVFGVQRGQTAEDARKRQAETSSAPVRASSAALRVITLVAPFVFIVGLVVVISLAIDAIFRANAPEAIETSSYWTYAGWTTQPWTVVGTIGCILVGLLFSWRVDINEFSIHHFYKNRLVRCYLGASRSGERKADWFTGFDPNDDLRLTAFDNEHRSRNGRCYPGPYPVVNCALNLVGGQDLAWQERKATSFVFTPKYCGYDIDRAVLEKGGKGYRSEAYVPTKNYYRSGDGPLLGMAMAISGAAANPNMGRATSPASAFLMAVFNVRLGWWIGNPRRADGASLPGPRLGLTYTALELFGGTDDTRKFVNLSDGGHFDNLGVYELVRRGCRYIVVCDAGQDGQMVCEDLGDLVRRCRTDFGVEIDIAIDRIAQLKHGVSHGHCVVGKIHYLNMPRRDRQGNLIGEDESPLVRGNRPAHEEGYLVYIKPSITGDEPQDVLEYHRRVPEFPHESTADQWFGESQFESYRKLGMHAAEQTFIRYQHDDTHSVGALQHLFERLHKYWHPPSMAIVDRSSQHATEYSRLLDMVRSNNGLIGLDTALFDAPGPLTAGSERDEFYVCNALIQLIENVYADLDLEHNHNHPHVQGWMHVFRRWAQQPQFRKTWKTSESTYAERFRNFYNDRLRGRPLGLRPSFIASFPVATPAPRDAMDAFNAPIAAGAGVIAVDVASAVALAQGALAAPAGAGGGVAGSLAGLLTALQGKIQLSLELRNGGLEQAVIDALRAADWRCQDYALTSRHERILSEARRIHPDVRLGLIIDDRASYEATFKDFLESDIDFLAPSERVLDDDDLHEAEECRVPLVPWTVNSEDRLRMFLRHSIVAGVVTTNVALALRVKKELS